MRKLACDNKYYSKFKGVAVPSNTNQTQEKLLPKVDDLLQQAFTNKRIIPFFPDQRLILSKYEQKSVYFMLPFSYKKYTPACLSLNSKGYISIKCKEDNFSPFTLIKVAEP